jgi:hypothetical protein
MVTESDIREQQSIEAVLEEYVDLTLDEVLELEELAYKHYSAEEWNAFCPQIEKLEKQREDIISRMGFTNWETAMERVEGYVYEKMEPLIEIGLTKEEERTLDDAEIAINDAIHYVKCVEQFDPVVDVLFDALHRLEQLRDRTEHHGHP